MTPTLMLAAAAATSMLFGCGDSTPEQDALNEASATLHGLGVAGSEALPSWTDRKLRYEKVLRELKPIADGGGGGGGQSPGAAAASGLVSRAQCGLGEIAAIDAAEAEREVSRQISGIRAAFEQWQSQRAIADTLKAYDPTSELAKLDEEIRQREAESARAAAEKQKQVALVEQTRAKAAEARAQVENFRNQEASIRASVANASQTQRAAAIEQALTIKRQGDEYEKLAAGFDAVAASQAPEVETQQNTIDKLNRQVQLLRDAKKSLVARADASKAQAAVAAGEADQVAVRVTDLLKSLEETRGKVTAPTDEAARLYAAAVNAAKKSGLSGGAGGAGGGKSSANMAAGNAQQSHADVLAAKARGLGAYASLIQTLNTGGQAGVSMEMLTQAKQAHTDAVKAAEESYRSAITMFESAGGTAEAKAKVEKLTEAIKKLTVAADAPPAPTDGAPAGDGEAGDGAGANADKPVEKPAGDNAATFDKAAVEAEVREFAARTKAELTKDNFQIMMDQTHLANADETKTMKLMVTYIGSVAAMDRAVQEKFGKDVSALASESANPKVKAMAKGLDHLAGKSMLDKARDLKLDPATVKVEVVSATEAKVFDDPDEPNKPSTLKKIDGAWKMIEDSEDIKAGIALAPMFERLVKGLDELRGRLESGKFATADDFLTAMVELISQTAPRPGGG